MPHDPINSDRDTPEQVRGGLPHSEIPGSPIARISPGLFAACRVLPRLSVPRHPPDALLLRLIAITPPAHRGKTRTLRQQGPSPRKLVPAKAGAGTHTQAASHEDTSRTHPARSRLACPPRSHDNSLFTLQSTPAPAELDPPGAQLASRLAKRRCSRGCSRNPCREAATGLRPWWR